MVAGERIRGGQAVVLLGHVKCEILDFQVGTWERLPCRVVSLELTGGVRAGGGLWELSGIGDSKVMGMDQVSQEHRRGLGTEPCGSLPFQVWKRRAQRRCEGGRRTRGMCWHGGWRTRAFRKEGGACSQGPNLEN